MPASVNISASAPMTPRVIDFNAFRPNEIIRATITEIIAGFIP